MLVFFNIWIILTLALYYFGPTLWLGSNSPTVFIVVVGCMIFFNFGVRSIPRTAVVIYSIGFPRVFVLNRKLSIVILLLFCAVSALEVHQITGKSLFSLSTWLASDESVYNLYQQKLQDRQSASVFEILTKILRSIIFPISLTILCKYFRSNYIVAVLFAFPILGLSLARGTNKEIFDLAIIFLIIIMFYGARRKLILAVAAIAPALMLAFISNIASRYSGDIPNCIVDDICFNFDSYLAKISVTLEVGFVLFSSYITQGYEGLSRAVDLPYEFTFFIGHLPPLQRILEQVFDFDLSTFNERLSDAGWDTSWRWTSVYPVLANDFHWLFLPGYFFMIGRALSIGMIAWKKNREPSALAMVILVAIFLAYSSANMQLAISLEWTFATIMLVYVPLISVRVYKPRKKIV